MGDLNWEYEKRAKTVVDDPIKREMVRDWFEQDSITVESELLILINNNLDLSYGTVTI